MYTDHEQSITKSTPCRIGAITHLCSAAKSGAIFLEIGRITYGMKGLHVHERIAAGDEKIWVVTNEAEHGQSIGSIKYLPIRWK